MPSVINDIISAAEFIRESGNKAWGLAEENYSNSFPLKCAMTPLFFGIIVGVEIANKMWESTPTPIKNFIITTNEEAIAAKESLIENAKSVGNAFISALGEFGQTVGTIRFV